MRKDIPYQGDSEDVPFRATNLNFNIWRHWMVVANADECMRHLDIIEYGFVINICLQ